MKTIFKTAMILLFISCSLHSIAQDTTKTDKKIKEYVLSIGNIAPLNIAIRYKKQLKGRTFFKLDIINLSAGATEYEPELSSSFGNKEYHFSAGVQCGLEFRKSMTSDFTFFHGPNIGLTYYTTLFKPRNPALPAEAKSLSQTYTVAVPYTLGILFHLKNHFFISAEINPALSASWNTYKNLPDATANRKQLSTNFGFGNTYGLLSLVYRL
jgi:hypothetical protein